MTREITYRHNRITRLTHWLNAIALVVLFMSGLQIFNAHSSLYWGSKSEPDEAFFSIYAADENGSLRGYMRLYGWSVETTGFLGIQNTEMGPVARAFPSWLTIPSYFWLAGGRRWHFFFAWLFVLNGFLYCVDNVFNGHAKKFLLAPRDIAAIPAMILYYLHVRRESPQEGEYNPLQKMAYTGVFFVLTPVVVLSGLAMSPEMNAGFNWLPALFGGRQSARTIHFVCTFLFAAFTFGHVFMVMTTGLVNNMRSMITGWYVEKTPYAGAEAAVAVPVTPIAEPVYEPGPTANEPPAPAHTQGDIAVAQSPEEKLEQKEEPKEEGKNGGG
ncbi:MAG: cytochrome b/b6 domain-containing protein [Candidatus Binatia bacterium]